MVHDANEQRRAGVRAGEVDRGKQCHRPRGGEALRHLQKHSARICPNVFGRSTGCCMKRCGSFWSRTKRNGTCAAAMPPEESICTPGRTAPKREKHTPEKYTKRTGCRRSGSPKITFFRPKGTPCSSEHTAPARPPRRQYPFFLPSISMRQLLYETSISHCVTHKTDSRKVLKKQRGVFKRKILL